MDENNFKRIKQAIRVSRYYYENNYDQNRIAKEMGLSRPTVSRLLQYAKESGYIQTKILDPYSDIVPLANQIQKKYNLKKVIVAYTPSNDNETIIENIGKAGAEFIQNIVEDGDSIGISWGRTIDEVSKNLSPDNNFHENVKIVQLKGSIPHIETSNFVWEIMSRFATAFHAFAESLQLPVMFDNQEIRRAVETDSQIRFLLNEGNETNIALFSCGTVRSDAMLFNSGYLNSSEIDNLKNSAVGDLNCRFINENGNVANSKINNRTIGIPINNLREKKYSILLAGGEQKIKAIKATLLGKYANVLITDRITAGYLLNN